MTLRIIDIETTGTDPEKDHIIEIASVDLVKERSPDLPDSQPIAGLFYANRMQTYVACEAPIPSETSAVHHIVSEDLAGAPDLTTAAERFAGATYYIAHNAEFEMKFAKAKGLAWPRFICTYKCALRIWPDAPAHNNQALRYMLDHVHPFGVHRDRIRPHRAASDTLVTAGVLAEMIKLARWSDMITWSQEPALHKWVRFGKHKGATFADLAQTDPDYLDWIIFKSDMDDGVKHSARVALQQRRAA